MSPLARVDSRAGDFEFDDGGSRELDSSAALRAVEEVNIHSVPLRVYNGVFKWCVVYDDE